MPDCDTGTAPSEATDEIDAKEERQDEIPGVVSSLRSSASRLRVWSNEGTKGFDNTIQLGRCTGESSAFIDVDLLLLYPSP